MCAIIDANVVSEVFGTDPSEAAMEFIVWLENNSRGQLVVGGKLLEELEKVSKFQVWALKASFSGKIRLVDDDQVNQKENFLRRNIDCSSNDLHIIALAQVSGARLLYSNDKDLQQDFKNKDLINHPRGKIYTTNEGREKFSSGHKKLLARRDLCQSMK